MSKFFINQKLFITFAVELKHRDGFLLHLID